MALKLLQPGLLPLGQFDGDDTESLTLMGGEIVTLKSVVATSATDKAAKDVFDGYVNSQKRVVVTRNVTPTKRPLMLADEGITGYGTLFGSVVGGTVGQNTTGSTLGPHTATGSGKVTLWATPGLYAVSLDGACDQAADGLVSSNTSLATGTALTYTHTNSTTGGRLTPVGSTAALVGIGNTTVVGRFVDFVTKGALVTTPNYLVSALASARTFDFAVFNFTPPRS
jgi:outer membrane lipoprotein SlyB